MVEKETFKTTSKVLWRDYMSETIEVHTDIFVDNLNKREKAALVTLKELFDYYRDGYKDNYLVLVFDREKVREVVLEKGSQTIFEHKIKSAKNLKGIAKNP